MDPILEPYFLGLAHALYMNRLHVLRLTEVVRLGIRPNSEDNIMEIPPQLDRELQQQAIAYVLVCFPEEFGPKINEAKFNWVRLD